jgi:pimeloyl-ACP methyl ester carboxylesterase
MTDALPDRPPNEAIEISQIVDPSVKLATPPAQGMERLENALKDIYFVSGLGADERVFRLLKFEGYQPVHIRWLDPEPNEAIDHYAQRLIAQIHTDRPIIVGLSFGGIISVEIAKQIAVEKVIIISSAKDQFEIPPYFKFFRWFPVHCIFPFKSLLWAGYWLAYWFFSLETIDERHLLKAILLDTDARFIKWATHKVVTWKNQTIPDNLYHIHGLSDRIFPVRFVNPDFTVEQGGHFMIMNRAVQISALLEKLMG